MSHDDFQNESERLKGTARGEKPAGADPPRACLTCGGNKREELESDPPGTSLGEVLSCRIFDPGKGVQEPEILVDSMDQRQDAQTADWQLEELTDADSEKASTDALRLLNLARPTRTSQSAVCPDPRSWRREAIVRPLCG